MSYRQQFASTSAAEAYDLREYADGSYGELLWRIEREQLATVVAELRADHPTIDLLDFATGTGRILSFLEDKVDRAVGVDVSAAMVELARSRVHRAELHCRDITVPAAEVEGAYDLITAFRFVLNAEPPLRLAALAALRDRLRDDSSVLVFNNHGNLWSHKALLYPMHKARRAGRDVREGNCLSHRAIHALAARAGLRIEAAVGCGLFGARLARRLPADQLLRWEQDFARSRRSHFGSNVIYVARRATRENGR